MVVAEAGLQSWLVDCGRPRTRALGVPLGGAADRFAYQLSNLLLGNPPDAVAVEVTLKGPTLHVNTFAVAVVFGAPFEVTLNETSIPANTTFRLCPSDVLRIGGSPTGCRAYLAVAGGFATPVVLGSRSGLVPLMAGDVLDSSPADADVGRGLNWNGPAMSREQLLRVLPGPQADWFTRDEFFDRIYTVAPASNRMGIRLLGEPLTKRDAELVSEAVAPGAVQVTHDGRPVILGVDGQTIGGYPKVAQVIRADLDILGQLRPSNSVRFQLVSASEAEAAAQIRHRQFRNWMLRLSASSNR